MNRDIRKITDGAMMAGLIAVFLLLDRYMAGTLSAYFVFIMPLPMVFFTAKYGWKDAMPVLFAVFVFLFLFGTISAMFFGGAACILGVIYGDGVFRRVSSGRLLLRAAVCGAALEAAALVFYAGVYGINMSDYIAEEKELFTAIGQTTGVDFSYFADNTSLMVNLYLFSTILMGMLEGYVTHMLSTILLRRMKIAVPKPQPIEKYFPPKWSGYLGLLLLVGYYFAMFGRISSPFLYNTMMIGGMASAFYLGFFGIVGITTIVALTQPARKGIGRLIGILLFFLNLMLCAVAGFLYITTDYHEKLLKGGTENATENR